MPRTGPWLPEDFDISVDINAVCDIPVEPTWSA
jgi:hypothetical protein